MGEKPLEFLLPENQEKGGCSGPISTDSILVITMSPTVDLIAILLPIHSDGENTWDALAPTLTASKIILQAISLPTVAKGCSKEEKRNV